MVVVVGAVVGVVAVDPVAPVAPETPLGVVVVVVVGVTTTLEWRWVMEARYPTVRTEKAVEPRKTDRDTSRTRANRRSRCWGVRGEGVTSPASQAPLRIVPVSPKKFRNPVKSEVVG